MAEIFAIADPLYQPAMRVVTAITRATNASVTTSFAHNYGTGMVVRILVPLGFGMPEINKRTGTIVVTGSTTFTIDIDSTGFTAFAVPSFPVNGVRQYAQCISLGESNDTFAFATENVL